jgi:diguanylate cyclase (GGDEF)-like protein
MRFRIAGRHDPLLLAGLTFALLVVFQRSLQYLFAVANDIERMYGVALLPALLILSVMFVFHMHANRREMHAEAAAAASEAALARARTRQLEQLMAFGQALSRSLTPDALHEAIWRYLPALANGADIWMVVRREGEWERLTDRARMQWAAGSIEAIAEAVVHTSADRFDSPDGVEQGGFTCYAIASGGAVIAVVGLPAPAATADLRRSIATAATLLGIALRNVQLFADVRDNGMRDALTGCFNRAHGLEMLEAELARARRSDAAVSVMMFDVDRFKEINDEFGHPCGDEVLASIGGRLRQVLRRSDHRCRYGGDEFLIVLPETPAAGASRVAEWVRGEIEQIVVASVDAHVRPTISIGTATSNKGEAACTLLDRVDRALYAAKAAGRNCVRTAPSGARPLAAVASIAG